MAEQYTPASEEFERLADWLGEQSFSRNRRDYTDEYTTFAEVEVEALAEALLKSPWLAARDAQVRAEALRDAARSGAFGTSAQSTLLARADRIADTNQQGQEPVMSNAIKVTVSDPETGKELESRVIDNDFIVLCAGDRYIDGVQAYGNGTQVLTVKRRTNQQDRSGS